MGVWGVVLHRATLRLPHPSPLLRQCSWIAAGNACHLSYDCQSQWLLIPQWLSPRSIPKSAFRVFPSSSAMWPLWLGHTPIPYCISPPVPPPQVSAEGINDSFFRCDGLCWLDQLINVSVTGHSWRPHVLRNVHKKPQFWMWRCLAYINGFLT